MTTKSPEVFAGNDSSIYIAQAMAVADLLTVASRDLSSVDEKSIPEASMLIFMLLAAASELDEADRAKYRTKLSAVKA